MENVYVYSDSAELYPQAVSLAKSLAQAAGGAVKAVAISACGTDGTTGGVDEAIILDGASELPEAYAQAIADELVAGDALAFVVASTATGRDIAAQVAALRGVPLASEILSAQVDGDGLAIERMMYGGAVQATDKLPAGSVVTVGPGKYEDADVSASAPERTIAATPASGASVRGMQAVEKGGADITAAERVVGVGRGVSTHELFEQAEDLASALDAEMGCTRSIAEEFKWLPNESYIGISGVTVNPKLYVALGISGQVQHVAGIRGADVIVAVDTNESAPIFKSADYGIVGDVAEVMPALKAALA